MQEYPTRNQASNSIYRVLTFEEVLTNVQSLNQTYTSIAGKQVGIHIEIEETYWYNNTYGLDVIAALMATLDDYNLTTVEECN